MIIKLKDKGITCNTKFLGRELLKLINSLSKGEAHEIKFGGGIYNLTEDDCFIEHYYMTNTVSEKEMAIPTQRVGIKLKDLQNITLDGEGSTLLYKGRMTEFVIDNCKNCVIKNFIIDNCAPSVADFKVVRKGFFYADILPCKSAAYTIKDGKFRFDCDLRPSAEYGNINCVIQRFDEKNDFTIRDSKISYTDSVFNKQLKAKENKDGTIRVHFLKNNFKKNYTYQLCTTLRDGCGAFVNRSSDTVFENCLFYFIHGMGILAQVSHNLTINNCKMIPNKADGRSTATFADMIHASMCSGTVKVTNCEFDGSRDDIINVHGNHFKIKNVDKNILELKYCHPQTYGFDPFDKGDEVEFINMFNLTPNGKGIVLNSEMISPRIIKLTLTEPVAEEIIKGNYVLENATKTSGLFVDNIKAKNIPTRGILVTTRQPVIIQNSTFYKTQMQAIKICDDAMSWYESGYVRDVLVQNNKFISCKEFNIKIFPEAFTPVEKPCVHKNIRIIDNVFEMAHNKVLFAKRTDGIVFKGNKIINCKKPKIIFNNCENITMTLDN